MRGQLRVGELRPSGRHEEPQEHQEGREEGGGGGHCGQEQCEVNPVSSSAVKYLQLNKIK